AGDHEELVSSELMTKSDSESQITNSVISISAKKRSGISNPESRIHFLGLIRPRQHAEPQRTDRGDSPVDAWFDPRATDPRSISSIVWARSSASIRPYARLRITPERSSTSV